MSVVDFKETLNIQRIYIEEEDDMLAMWFNYQIVQVDLADDTGKLISSDTKLDLYDIYKVLKNWYFTDVVIFQQLQKLICVGEIKDSIEY